MEEKKFVFQIETEGPEITIREGEALAPKYPLPLELAGNIETVSRFLEKRITTLDQKKCNLLISRKKMILSLSTDETDPYVKGKIMGQLLLDEDFTEFGINTGKKYGLIPLADFFKMHRYCFEDSTTAMKIVTELKNFKAKINKEVEKIQDQKGNARMLLEQTVQSNIPPSFTLFMPIFKNEAARKFEVEINIIVRDSEMECYLESLEANDLIKTLSGEIIDGELTKVAAIAPEIVLIEV